MEEKTTQAKSEKKEMTYEELRKTAGDLYQTNQRLVGQIQQLQQVLQNRDFEFSSFFLSMLFKVIDHPEMYDQEFVDWVVRHIQTALTTFAGEENGETKEKSNESE